MTDPPAFETSAFPALNPPEKRSDLASALAALEHDRTVGPCRPRRRRSSTAARRALLTLIFVVLLIGGIVDLVTSSAGSADSNANGSRASVVYANSQRGACLNWPPGEPDKPSFVQCRADHMFEVATPVGAADTDERCQLAVRDYLGARFDPNSRFSRTVLTATDSDGASALCGLQLLGTQGQPTAFKGSIAELDQSKVWPVGTCLGIDAANRSTDIPADCASTHALEVTGSVNLSERFPDGPPAEVDQRAFLGEVCAQLAETYLAPGTLLSYGLAPAYEPLTPESWAAGSRQVSCSIGRPGPQGWTRTAGGARIPPRADVPGPATPPSTSDAPPPPVYQEPLIPIAPAPAPPPAASPVPAPTAAPTTSVEPTTTALPPPPPAEPVPTSTEPPPDPNVILIPGLPPIYLPGYVPPPAPAPVPVPTGPLPGPPA